MAKRSRALIRAAFQAWFDRQMKAIDGFEVTLVGALAGVLTHKDTLHLSTQEASSLGTWYLLGAVGGALFFGYLTDRIGRKKLFMVTLGVYLVMQVAQRPSEAQMTR